MKVSDLLSASRACSCGGEREGWVGKVEGRELVARREASHPLLASRRQEPGPWGVEVYSRGAPSTSTTCSLPPSMLCRVGQLLRD